MPARTASKERKQETARQQDLPKDIKRYVEKYGERLSPTARRAKWITNPEESADRKGQTLITRDHGVIQRWAEERDAAPAAATQRNGRPRVLRLDFPGYGGQSLAHIEWDDWFRTFDERNLVFMYQQQLKNGNQSNFFRLDSPEREDG